MSFEYRESIPIPTNEDIVETLHRANQGLSATVDKLEKENNDLKQENKHLKEEVHVLLKALENNQINNINIRLLKLEDRVFALENSGVYNTKPCVSSFTVKADKITGDTITGYLRGTPKPTVDNSSNKTYTIEDLDDLLTTCREDNEIRGW